MYSKDDKTKLSYTTEIRPAQTVLYLPNQGAYKVKEIQQHWQIFLEYPEKYGLIKADSMFMGEVIDDDDISPETIEKMRLVFSTAYTLFFSLLSMMFAHIWRKRHKLGPLEWVMRKLSNEWGEIGNGSFEIWIRNLI